MMNKRIALIVMIFMISCSPHHEGTTWIGEVCKEAVTALDHKKPVTSGLFICPDPAKKVHESDPENHGLLPEELAAAIWESMNNGAAGICLFTPDRMTGAGWAVFEKAIHRMSNSPIPLDRPARLDYQ